MNDDVVLTDFLDAWSRGDRTALDKLMEVVYTELYASARRAMARERSTHTLDPTALVNEVYLRLVELKRMSWESRRPFFAFAASLMRQVLVDHARVVGAQKRPHDANRVPLEIAELRAQEPAIDALILDEALQEIEAIDPQMVRLIELRFFTGLTEAEAADALGVSRSSVQREWVVAKRLLIKLLDGKR
jgi:RNA polymerase sigma factor (TIGR02999 family)